MGAWDTYTAADGSKTKWYKLTDPWTYFPPGSAKGYGCIAIKRQLSDLGFHADGFGAASGVIGSTADKLIREAQASFSLTVDGIVGPTTAEALFGPLIRQAETSAGIPDRWAAKIVKLESAEDPGATGWADPDDHGLAQINVVLKGVTVAQAHDPVFAIPYLCTSLKRFYGLLHDWQAAVAAWNVNDFWAGKWLAAGKPSLEAVMANQTLTDQQKYWLARAAHYVELVIQQKV